MVQPEVQFSDQEMERRWRLVRGLMAAEELDALLIYGAGRYQADIHWATDWPGGREAYALFFRAGPPVLALQFFNHLPTARRLSRIQDVRWAGPRNPETVASILLDRDPAVGRIGIAGSLPFEQYVEIQRRLPSAQLRGVGGTYRKLRLVKSQEELVRFRYAGWLADLSMEALREGLHPGLLQDRMPALVEQSYLEHGGYSGIHYLAAMPMDGPYQAVPSQYLEPVPLAVGDVVITEITACYQGYQGQIHRTYSIGRPPSASWRRLHDAAVEAFTQIAHALRPGRTAQDVLEASGIVERLGYTIIDDLVHGADQLPPVLRTPRTQHQPYDRSLVLEENMVLVVQPNLVDERTGQGLQFGETLIVAAEGARSLHAFERAWVQSGG
ncbi:MAG: M24 family metallopeptidase [Thermaerobacter sp.]|nr:M24 family metallopeptidase [Thermaerobacter sp.]